MIQRLSHQPSVSGKTPTLTPSRKHAALLCQHTQCTHCALNAAMSVTQCRQQLSADTGRPIYQISLSSITPCAASTDSTDAFQNHPQHVLVAVRMHHQVAIYKAAQQQDRCNLLSSIYCAMQHCPMSCACARWLLNSFLLCVP